MSGNHFPKLAFVTNFCPHYRVKLFEEIAKTYDADFMFYSEGKEWYWQVSHGVNQGNFKSKYLRGFWLGKTRISLSLPIHLLFGHYDVIIKCINGKFALPITFLIAKLRNIPFILYTGIWTRLDTNLHKLIFPFTLFIYRHADAIVVYGSHVKKYLESEGIGSKKIFVAPHAVSNETYLDNIDAKLLVSLRSELEIPQESLVFLHLGRLEESKGISYLLHAFSKMMTEKTFLIVAGTGHESEGLIQLAKDLGISPQVRFVGYIPVNQTNKYYALADVFILASISTPGGKEPWGLTINEAFNHGLPVIVTDAVGAAAGGLVENGVNGLIVPEKNSAALSEAMRSLLDNDKRQEFAKNAMRKIENWTITEMACGFFDAVNFVNERHS